MSTPGMNVAEGVAEADDELEGSLPGAPAAVEPAAEGPRRKRLVGVAAAAGVLLLWLLFRSVPGEPTEGAPQAAGGDAVEDIANASDPSWMRSDSSAGPGVAPAPGGLVPPVFGPSAGGVQGAPVPAADSAMTSGAAGAQLPGETAPAPSQEAQADPRREAFVSALRSRPLQASATFSAPAEGAATASGEIPETPTLAQMEALADAEALRRSTASPPVQGGFAAPAATPPFIAYGDPGASHGSGSSYVTGGTGRAPQAAPESRMAARGAGEHTRFVVPVGTVIEGQLHTAVNSDLPGHVVGMVTRNVYDASQRVVVIPAYSWLFGTYESDVATGQARLVVQWTAVRFPSGQTFDLPALLASERTGASGLRGRVNNHYGRIFGHAVLSSVVATAFAGRGDPGQAGRGASADAAAAHLGQTASEVTRRNLSIKPTITVPRLTRFAIILDRDLVFTPPARE